jgi:class 3 adenylate cyclase
LLEGEAGIGKTRLVRELERDAVGAGLRVWHGRGREDLPLPYLLFQPLLAELAGGEPPGEDPAPAARALRSLLGEASRSDAASGAEAQVERLRLFHAVASQSFALARDRTGLVVLEDLHWADAASLDLLAHIVYAATDCGAPLRLLLLCTLRPLEGGEHLAAVLERIGREEICHRLELAGFDEVETEALIRACGVGQPSHRLVARIAEVSNGNPLFAEEILHLLEREHALVERGGRWTTRVDPAELALPERVTHAIASRTRLLGQACRDALASAACLGERFDADELASVLDSRGADLHAWLGEALRARVLVSRGDRFHFAHPLVRQDFYTAADPVQRRAIHRRIALALERRRSDGREVDVTQIAHHWTLGQVPGDEEVVLRHARLAGDQAFSVFASGEAARHYEAALDVDRKARALQESERADLHYRAALAHYRDMDAASCLAHLEQASETFRRIDDAPGLARALVEQVRTYLTLSPVAYGTLIDVSELESVLGRLGEEHGSLRGSILLTLTDAFMHARLSGRAEECARRAVEVGRKLADDRLLATAASVRGTVQSQRLDVRDALASYRESLRLATRAGDPWIEGWPLQRLPLVLLWLARVDEADAAVAAAARNARRTGDWADHSLVMGAAALLAALRGDFAAVESRARETMAMVRRSRYPWGGVLALTVLYAVRALQGEWAEAEDALGILEEPGRVFAEVGPAARSIAAVARLRLRALSQRATAEIREEAGKLARLIQAVGPEVGTIGPSCAFVEIADLLGDPSLAEGSVAALEFAEDRGVVFPAGGEYLLPRVQGVAASLARRWDAAQAYFDRACEVAQAAGARPDLARAELDHARMLVARGADGDREAAAEWLARALPALRDLGMEPFVKAGTSLARELGVHCALSPDAGSAGVEPTPRELELLALLARGRSDREIAEALLLGPGTVRLRTAALFEKIGVERRTEAAAWALERGLALPAAGRAEDAGALAPALGRRAPPPPRPAAPAAERIILVSDMEQSTELITRLGDQAAQALLRVHNRIVRSCLRAHRGVEIQHTGDGFIVAFDSASDAVRCAVAIERRLARRERSSMGMPLRVRIGLHAGTPLAEEGRLFGVAMNTTARICSRAAPREILASEAVRALSAGSGLSFEALGEFALKGLERPVPLHRVVWEEEAPPGGESV